MSGIIGMGSGITEPITKLIETIGHAVGKVYEPTHVRRMARAKAYELITIGEAMNSTINLPAEYINGEIMMSTQDGEELAKRTGNRLYFQELRKQQNIEAIVEFARANLDNETSVSNEPVDPDWTIRFFNSVEDVSNEEMQKLWSRVLAGEVKQPNSFSIRTLEKLKNISQAEALIFRKLTGCCFYDSDEVVFPYDQETNSQYGISGRDIIILSDCGLVDSTPVRLNPFIHNDSSFYVHNGNIVGVFCSRDKMNNKTDYRIQRLTDSGTELFKIIDISPNNQWFIEYLTYMSSYIGSSSEPFIVTAHKITSFDKGNHSWSEEDLLPVLNTREKEQPCPQTSRS